MAFLGGIAGKIFKAKNSFMGLDEGGIPAPGPDEMAIQKMLMDMMPQLMLDAGYAMEFDIGHLSGDELVRYQDNEKQISEWKARIDWIKANRPGWENQRGKDSVLDIEKNLRFHEQEQTKMTESGGYTMRKIYSKEAEAARKKFGAESSEYLALVEKEKEREITDEKQQKELSDLFMENSLKLARGDFTINEEQRAYVEKELAPQRKVLESLYGKEGEDPMAKWDELKRKADDAGLDVGALLGNAATIWDQIEASGQDIGAAIDKSVEVSKELLAMNIEDATGEIAKNKMKQAAALGRDPSDPAYSREIAQDVAREVGRLSLGVSERAAGQRVGLAEQQASARMQATQGQAQARMGLEQQASQMRQGIGSGQAQMGGAAAGAQFQAARGQQQMMNLQNIFGTYGGMIPQMQRMRLAGTKESAFETSMGASQAGVNLFSGAMAGLYGQGGMLGGSRRGGDQSGGGGGNPVPAGSGGGYGRGG